MVKQIYLEQVIKVANSSPYYRLLGMEVKEINPFDSPV
jgi:hypothetical protein